MTYEFNMKYMSNLLTGTLVVDRKHFAWTDKGMLKPRVLVCITCERTDCRKVVHQEYFFLLAMSTVSYILFFEYQQNLIEEFRDWLTFQKVLNLKKQKPLPLIKT